MRICLLYFVLFLGFTRSALADIAYDLVLDFAAKPEAGEVTGTLVLKKWPEAAANGRCLFLPFNDADYFFDPARGLTPSALQYGQTQKLPGSIQVKPSRHLVNLSRSLIRIDQFKPGMTISFVAHLPRWNASVQQMWYFNDFYPVPLVHCPSPDEDAMNYQRDLASTIHVETKVAKPWVAYHPATRQGHSLVLHGAKFSAVLARGLKNFEAKIGDSELSVVYYSAGFDQLIPQIIDLFRRTKYLLGPYPYGRLVVAETEDLEKSLTPGIITINRERQKSVNDPSSSMLNWNIWQIANFIPTQWFGVGLYPRSMREFWFHKGYADAIAFVLLKDSHNVSNLFAAGQGEAPLFNFDYRQAQDLVAGGLTFLQPFNALTNKDGITIDSLDEQHSLGYIRHALALRYLYWYIGSESFLQITQGFLESRQGQPASGREFIAYLDGLSTADSARVKDIILQWWSQDRWPDFFLKDVEESEPSGKGIHAEVFLGHDDDYKIPVDVEVVDIQGRRYLQRASPRGPDLVATFDLAAPLSTVDINPTRELFDADRFNNSNRSYNLNVFPGQARTFPDDQLTLLWLPLIMKLPGEPLSILVTGQAFQYIQSSYTMLASYVPSEGRLGFQGYFLTDIPRFGLFTVVNATQDFGAVFKGERLIDVGLYRAPLITKDPNIELGVRARSRQILGWSDSLHQTIALRLKIVPNSPGTCNYEVKSDLESTPSRTKAGFQYQRNFLSTKSNCRIGSIDWGGRIFAGSLSGSGDVPNNVRFLPQNVDEARVRIDSPTIAPRDNIASLGIDLLWAAQLPLPETMFFIPRESRFRAFYDVAAVSKPVDTIKDGGLGLLVPIGGDAVGKNSISVLQLSALMVLYREIEGKADYRPGLLIDFLGKL